MTVYTRADTRTALLDAALGLSFAKRIGRPIDVPAIDFGPAQLVLLPAESFVEFQLAAQKLRDKNHVPVEKDDEVIVTNGGIHGLFAAFHALLDELFEDDVKAANRWLKQHGRSLYAQFG